MLDIKVKEQSIENLCRGRAIYEPPRYMTVNTAVDQLLEIEEIRKEGGWWFHSCKSVMFTDATTVYNGQSLCVGAARIGQEDEKVE